MSTGIVTAFRTRLWDWLKGAESAALPADRDIATKIRELEARLDQVSGVPAPSCSCPAPKDFSKDCILGSGSAIAPEAVIENIRNDKKYIRIGEHSYIRGRLLTYGHAGEIDIGNWCYIGARTEIWSMCKVTIGNRVLVSHGVNIIDGSSHSMDALERHQHFKNILLKGHPSDPSEVPGIQAAPITIEDDAWISFGVTILKGVTIGARSIIAAGSLVTKDVPPDSLYRSRVEPVITPLNQIK